MSLLAIIQRVTDESGLPRPVLIAAGTDTYQRQLLALANTTVEELMRKNWPVLTRQYTITTISGQEEYAFPTDFKRAIADTVFNSSSYYAVRGALSATEWNRTKYALPSLNSRFRWRVYGSPLKAHFTPTPSGAETVIVEYITSKPIVQSDGVTYTSLYTQDTDGTLLPEELVRMGVKWRIKKEKGLDYAADYNEYMRAVDEMYAQQMSFGAIDIARRSVLDTPEITDGYIPEGNWS